MKRRNFIKIATGAFLGLATGVGLAKGAGYWEGVTIVDDLKPLTAADLRKAINDLRAKGMRPLKPPSEGYYYIVVHSKQYETVKRIVERYNFRLKVIKSLPIDRNSTIIPALSKERRGFK